MIIPKGRLIIDHLHYYYDGARRHPYRYSTMGSLILLAAISARLYKPSLLTDGTKATHVPSMIDLGNGIFVTNLSQLPVGQTSYADNVEVDPDELLETVRITIKVERLLNITGMMPEEKKV